MGNPSTQPGTVYRDSSLMMLARIEDWEGNYIKQADVEKVEYTIYKLDEDHPEDLEAASVVSGHDAVEVSETECIFDTLQGAGGSDKRWTKDTIGYNFRWTLDVKTNLAFDDAARKYRVRWKLTPKSGQAVHWDFGPDCV